MKNTVNKYFEVKVKMQKTQEDGTQKKVSEQYVVEAATFGEAERRITECLKPYIEGEFDVTDIKIAGYSQIVNGDENADKYFKAKVSCLSRTKSAVSFTTYLTCYDVHSRVGQDISRISSTIDIAVYHDSCMSIPACQQC